MAVVRWRLVGERAAASLTDRLRHHFLAVDPDPQLGGPAGPRGHCVEFKAIEQP